MWRRLLYSFLIFCLCSCFPFASFLVPGWFHFLSPCPVCLLKQIEAHLLWWSLCLELKIDPETQQNVMRKENECKQAELLLHEFVLFVSGGWRVSTMWTRLRLFNLPVCRQAAQRRSRFDQCKNKLSLNGAVTFLSPCVAVMLQKKLRGKKINGLHV